MKIFTAVLVSVLCVSLCCAGEVDVFELSKRGTPDELKAALEAGAVFNVSRDYNGEEDGDYEEQERIFDMCETPLHLAAAYNPNPESIKFLVSQGIDVNAGGSEGNGTSGTALACAMWHNNYKAAKALLESGANPNQWYVMWFYCATTFHDAARITENSADIKLIIEALLKAGGDINIHDELDNEEWLHIRHYLKSSGYNSLVLTDGKITDTEAPFHLDRLSRVDTLNWSGTFTPLMYAVLYDNPDAVNIFLDYGADAKIRSAESMTAFDYAKCLPKDSKLRKSPAYNKLRKATRN